MDINTILNAAPAIIQGLGLVCLGCSAIAAITPTPKDDSFFKKAYRLIDLCALNMGRAKER